MSSTVVETIYAVKALNGRLGLVTGHVPDLGGLVVGVVSEPTPDRVVGMLDRVLAPLDECLAANQNRFEELDTAMKANELRVSVAESALVRYQVLGKSFDAAVRWGWKFFSDDGHSVESRCVGEAEARAAAARMVYLFGLDSPGVGCSCVVLDYRNDQDGKVVARSTASNETAERS